jgi:hypothetical protein
MPRERPKSREYWLERAEEARARAEEVTNIETKDSLLRAMESYEGLASLSPYEDELDSPDLAINPLLRD